MDEERVKDDRRRTPPYLFGRDDDRIYLRDGWVLTTCASTTVHQIWMRFIAALDEEKQKPLIQVLLNVCGGINELCTHVDVKANADKVLNDDNCTLTDIANMLVQNALILREMYDAPPIITFPHTEESIPMSQCDMLYLLLLGEFFSYDIWPHPDHTLTQTDINQQGLRELMTLDLEVSKITIHWWRGLMTTTILTLVNVLLQERIISEKITGH